MAHSVSIPAAWLAYWLPELSEAELKILLYLHSHTRDGRALVSLRQLEYGVPEKDRGAGITSRQAQKAIPAREAKGLIEAARRQKQDGRPDTTIYRPIWYIPPAATLLTKTPPKRLPVQERVRRRDGTVCQYCGTTEAAIYQVDHVIPQSLGGVPRLFNLVVACDACNLRKGEGVWLPRNLDFITEGYPAWRKQVLALGVTHE